MLTFCLAGCSFLVGGAFAQQAEDTAAEKCVTSLAIQQEIYAMANKMRYLMAARGVGTKTTSPLKGKYSAKCASGVVWEVRKEKNKAGSFEIIAYHPKGKKLYTFQKSTANVSSAARK